ncbi:MAG: VWA domain-containing protein [Pyrinomonadaceae bacterium]
MKIICAVFLLCCFIFVPNARAQKAESDEVIKVKTDLVSVPVVVNDRQGRYIPNLTQTDFSIFQDGEKQEISFFAAEEEPLNVAILLDTSKSTRNILGEIRDAAEDFVKLLQPADRAMIVTFDYQVSFLSPLTADHRTLESAISRVDIGEFGGTVMRDAVAETINKSFANVKGRKAIILLTDGKDHGSSPTEDELLNNLQESDVLIYSVYYDTSRQQNFRGNGGFGGMGGMRRGGGFGRRGDIFGGDFPTRNPQAERRRERQERVNEAAKNYLSELSQVTAGRFYEGANTNLKKTFAQIADELKKQYRIGFYPKDETAAADDAVHQIKVKVNRSDVAIRARSTYRLKQ